MILGVTGRAGVGKSFLCHHLPNERFDSIELDVLGHEVLMDPSVKMQLKAHFGDSIFQDNDIDRHVLGQLVFSNKERLSQLNAIVHPMMYQRVMAQLRPHNRHTVIIGALIDEIGLSDVCDRLIGIDAPIDLIRQFASDPDRIDLIHRNQRNINAYSQSVSHSFMNRFDDSSIQRWVSFVTDIM